jgi:thioredoxin 1
MSNSQHADDPEPRREDIDQLHGAVLLEFGASWCGHCQALRPHIDDLTEEFTEVHHIKVEDGKGRRLGRTFGVKLWPTLVYLRDGQIVEQLVRPSPQKARAAMEKLMPQAHSD